MKDRNNEKMYPHPYYPIGSIFLSVNNTNPSKWFSGTWELISQGRTLVGVDTNDTDFNEPKKTGGEKTHTLSVDEMPKHAHSLYGYMGDGGGNTSVQLASSSANWATENFMSSKGENQSHNNLQPYFTCYIWCRTA